MSVINPPRSFADYKVDKREKVAGVLKQLPPVAPAHYEHARDGELREEVAREAQWKKGERLRAERDEAQGELSHLERQILPHGKIDVSTEARLELLRDRVAELKQAVRNHPADAKTVTPAYSVAKLDNFLARIDDPSEWRSCARETDPKKAMSVLERIDARRSAILEQMEADERAQLSNAEALGQAMRQIEKQAQRGKLHVRGCYRLGRNLAGQPEQGGIVFPKIAISGASQSIPDALAVLCWLEEDRLKEAVKKLLTEVAPKSSLSRDERPKRLAAYKAELLRLDYEEESAVFALESIGNFVRRRSSLDPRAVLQITNGASDESDVDFG